MKRELLRQSFILICSIIIINWLGQMVVESKLLPVQQKKEQTPGEESIRIDTSLVTVPVIVSDRNDVYVPDMRAEEFIIFEDGVQQEIGFFATVKEPFHVVLMLDTSASTQEKLGRIQAAAKAFVSQLQSADKVKVISFDDRVDDLCDFTSDRNELDRVIDRTRSGEGTKLYDAVMLGLRHLKRIKGRKAIVLFTDGVDWHSDAARYEDNTRSVEESEVIVFPIRYNTRPETEEMIRNQQEMLGETDLGLIFGGPNNRSPRGTTPPTVPGESGPATTTGRSSKDDPYRINIPPILMPLPRTRYPDGRLPDDRYPGDRRFPRDPRFPDDPIDTGRPDRLPDNTPGNPPTRRRNDNIGVMLDNLYETGDRYLAEMAEKSGGRLYRADTLRDLPGVFAGIANELRNQYSLGYYPTNSTRDGKYHKIQVKSTRKDVVVRARPGYRSIR